MLCVSDSVHAAARLHGMLTLSIKTPIKLSILKRALSISLVVGTVLNIVNQGNEVALGHNVQWFSFALNYLVPFCIATYSAWANDRKRARTQLN